jgi:hypothetical protein
MIDATKYGPPTVGPIRLAWRRLRLWASLMRSARYDPRWLKTTWQVAGDLETAWGPLGWNRWPRTKDRP